MEYTHWVIEVYRVYSLAKHNFYENIEEPSKIYPSQFVLIMPTIPIYWSIYRDIYGPCWILLVYLSHIRLLNSNESSSG